MFHRFHETIYYGKDAFIEPDNRHPGVCGRT